jgi:RNA polymerase sigma-70 factor (ECF subfamily)
MEIASIHSQFYQVLYNYIVSKIKNKDDAADILQEVFIKIAAKLSTLTDKGKLKSWIFSITRNAIIDYYRKNKHGLHADVTDKMIDEIADESGEDITKGLDKCLLDFIDKLPEEYRSIIVDSELKGIKQKDLVDKYNIAYSSVRSRVQRGRTRLKEMLLNCCKIEADSRGNIIKATLKENHSGDCGACT